MKRGRIEAFSDGVLAIVITIMVLEMKVPHGDDWGAIAPLWPRALGYLLSFVYIGIYWNNHHHLLHGVERVTGGILWANLHLLFWLSLVPFATAWMGESHFAAEPTSLYGAVLLMAAIAFTILQKAIVGAHGRDAVVARAIGRDLKGKASIACYLAAIPLAFAAAWIAGALFVAVALLWLVPDRRIEKALGG
ncbi:MAG: DUF1211 domain-containing protein [Planctomycetes bacterium]|nr:DUF1211 domain-containing protein [Planctomycetota bacterium]